MRRSMLTAGSIPLTVGAKVATPSASSASAYMCISLVNPATASGLINKYENRVNISTPSIGITVWEYVDATHAIYRGGSPFNSTAGADNIGTLSSPLAITAGWLIGVGFPSTGGASLFQLSAASGTSSGNLLYSTALRNYTEGTSYVFTKTSTVSTPYLYGAS